MAITFMYIRSTTDAADRGGWLTWRTASGSSAEHDFTPRNMASGIKSLTLKLATAPGTGNSNKFRFQDTSLDDLTDSVRVADAATSATQASVNATLPVFVPAPASFLIATASGNLSNGSYSYKVSFVINGIESVLSNTSSASTVDATHKQIFVDNIPIGPTGTTARKLYRNAQAGTTTHQLVTTISDNTTTSFTDNVADGSRTINIGTALTAGAPTAGGSVDIAGHQWYSTFVISGAEGPLSPASGTRTPTAGNQTVPLSAIPLGPTGTTARKIYRSTDPGGSGSTSVKGIRLVGTISDNTTTTFSDTFADTSLGAYAPTHGNSLVGWKNSRGGAAGTGTAANLAIEYVCDSPDELMTVYGGGDPALNVGAASPPASKFTAFFGSTVTTEINAQIPWPIAGFFQFFYFFGGTDAGELYKMTLRINGADAITMDRVFKYTGTTAQLATTGTEVATKVAVAAGDLVCFSLTITNVPIAALITAAGNVNAGTHSYRVTFVVNGVEQPSSNVSNTVTTDASHAQVSLTNIAVGPTGTTARKLYRTAAGGASTAQKLLDTINDNSTTTYTDNIADASLGATVVTGGTGSFSGEFCVGFTPKA